MKLSGKYIAFIRMSIMIIIIMIIIVIITIRITMIKRIIIMIILMIIITKQRQGNDVKLSGIKQEILLNSK